MDWFEIFKVGKHTDSAGHTREWDLKDLEEIASSYDPVKHEAPIVIGHPEMDSPAYGWIETLKVEGEKLLAKPKEVYEDLKNWVKQGLYKKVSIALYPDLTLRHVGFLGGTPPAVKGLKQATFGDKKPAWIIESDLQGIVGAGARPAPTVPSSAYADKACSHMNPDETFIGGFDGCVEHMMSCEGHDEDSSRKICAYIGRKAGKIHSDLPAEALAKAGHKGGTTMREWITKFEEAIGLAKKELTPDPSIKFTEADIQAKVKDAEDRTFAEAQKKIDAEKKEKEDAQRKLKEIETQKKKEDIASFCEAMCKDGKLTPALRKIIEPIMNFASDPTLTKGGEGGFVIEFSDGVKKSALDGIKDFLTELPKVVTFKEVTPKDGPNTSGSAGEKISALIQKKMDEKKIPWGQAFSEVQIENIELAKQYQEEFKHEIK